MIMTIKDYLISWGIELGINISIWFDQETGKRHWGNSLCRSLFTQKLFKVIYFYEIISVQLFISIPHVNISRLVVFCVFSLYKIEHGPEMD